MKKNNIYLIISWLLVIIWMLVIFNFSAVNGDKSAKSSIGILSKTVEFTSNVLYKIKVISKPLTKKQITNMANALNYPARKCLHIIEYFILTLLLLNAFLISKTKKVYLLSYFMALIYSITDEFHQLFTARTGSIIDVLIDSVGIMLAILLVQIINGKYKKI